MGLGWRASPLLLPRERGRCLTRLRFVLEHGICSSSVVFVFVKRAYAGSVLVVGVILS